MVVETDGYQAAIEYLIEHIQVFQSGSLDSGSKTIEDLCMERISADVMTICSQHPDIDENAHFKIMKEVDVIFTDMGDVLKHVWEKYPSQAQATFLEEYFLLIKNLFDSALFD